jgi:hypothetical protein
MKFTLILAKVDLNPLKHKHLKIHKTKIWKNKILTLIYKSQVTFNLDENKLMTLTK